MSGRTMPVATALILSLVTFSTIPNVAQALDWANDPIIQSEDCNNLEYPDVISFLQNFYYPTLSYSSDQRASGQQMMATYAIASALITRSQICLAQALELKKLADKLNKQSALLTSGTSMSKRQIKQQRKLTAEASTQIEKAAEQVDQLSPAQRKMFGLGSAAFMAGTYATAQLFRAVEKYMADTKEDLSEINKPKPRFGMPNMGDVRKVVGSFGTVNTMRVLFTGLKEHMTNLYNTSKFLLAYSKRQKVDLPPDATKQLSNVSDWV